MQCSIRENGLLVDLHRNAAWDGRMLVRRVSARRAFQTRTQLQLEMIAPSPVYRDLAKQVSEPGGKPD